MMKKSVRQELIRSKGPGVCMLWYCEAYLSIPWLDMKEKMRRMLLHNDHVISL